MMTAQEFFIALPLYKKVNFNKIDELWNFNQEVINTQRSIRSFCSQCDKESVFVRFRSPHEIDYPIDRRLRGKDIQEATRILRQLMLRDHEAFQVTDFVCSQCHHSLIFFSFTTETFAMKVGQYPSYADLFQQADVKYRKVLSAERFKEFNTGIGLAAHGVGIGSYSYLRRILEDLVDEAFRIASDVKWEENEYQRSRFVEKIEKLSDFLPEFMVENKNLYGIMSTGLHDLSEEECLKYFDLLRGSIEMILDDKIAQKEKDERRKLLKHGIANLTGELKSTA
jgi:hypothetical protein